MLRKRTRSHQKDQNMGQLTSDAVSESYFHSDFLAHKHKNNSFFNNVPGLFVGFNPKGSESDSVRSPTSPLDFRVFSNLGNSFRSPRSSHEGGHQKIWDNNKVGLSIIDSLDYDAKQSGKVLQASESKNILFGPKMRIKTLSSQRYSDSFEAPKSLPENVGVFPYKNARPSNLQKVSSDVLFEIGDAPFGPESGNFLSCSLDSGRSMSHLDHLAKNNSLLSSRKSVSENRNGPATSPAHSIISSKMSNSSDAEQSLISASLTAGSGLIGKIPPSEIELSEDYTCVRIHGPNPKVTHIFGDCILECPNNELANFGKNNDERIVLPAAAECCASPTSYPPSDFLKLCFSCKKKLDGEDIYMYRGEKAFCSWNCRLQEILVDEEMEKTNTEISEDSAEPSNHEEFSEMSLFISS